MKQIPPTDSWHKVDSDRCNFHPLMPALTLVSLLERYLVLETAICRVATSENDRPHIYSLWYYLLVESKLVELDLMDDDLGYEYFLSVFFLCVQTVQKQLNSCSDFFHAPPRPLQNLRYRAIYLQYTIVASYHVRFTSYHFETDYSSTTRPIARGRQS